MARYCFYCGRALSPGEKCTCREDTTSPEKADSGASRSGYNTDKSTNRAKKNNNSTGFNQASSGSWKNKFKNKYTSNKEKNFKHSKTKNKTFYKPDKAAIFAGFQQILRYFTRPADTIRQASQFADQRKAFLLLFIECIAGGFLFISMTRQSRLSALMELTIIKTGLRVTFMNNLFLFAQGIAFILCLHFIIIALIYTTLRFIARQPTDFIRLYSAISPVSFYSTIFIFMAISALSTSLVHAGFFLCCSFAISTIIIFLAIRQLCQLNENRALILSILLMVVYGAIISVLIGLTMPVLSTLFDMSIVI